MKALIFYIVIVLPLLGGCKAQAGFDSFTNEFVKTYQSLHIADLQLSYVDNLQQLPNAAGIEKQMEFFNHCRAAIAKYKRQELTPSQQTDYDLIVYESKLNLEKLALCKKWLAVKPAAIPSTGLYTIPLGKEWYAWFLKRWVADEVTPDEIYAFGMKEVESVKKHIEDIRLITGMGEDSFYTYLNNASFFVTDAKVIQHAFESVRDTVLHHLPGLFTTTNIPRVEIKQGANQALAQTPGYYNGNTFYYNLFDKPYNKRQFDWLFIHEAIPGHHYQFSITGKLKLSKVQQLFYYLGYAEGWGAYAEYLGKDLGVYKTPYDELGKWEWDIVRSVRVPLDVGINYYGWTDEQALAFWKKNIRGQDDIAMREINRIKRWPAQVVTYKYGAAKILQWRDELQQKEGSRFDIKAFHDKILNHGTLPFFMVEKNVMG
ncbi:MAG TPA: DUF885 domain-containing protein [Chitinophagaceae bacterium]|nr:DUF885 domain-containing protein [Chitinophagaceae bacterium]